jgi:hypothetical protein
VPNDERELLGGLNTTELVQIARSAGLGNVGQDLEREELIDLIVEGVEPEDGCDEGELIEPDRLERWRRAMERHISKNRKRLLSQLPGCNGKCTEFGCPDLIVTRCWDGFSRDMV